MTEYIKLWAAKAVVEVGIWLAIMVPIIVVIIYLELRKKK